MHPNIAKKYKFNLKTGHYDILHPINEADEPANNEQSADNQNNNQLAENNHTLPNIETEEVVALQQQRDNEINRLNSDIKKYNDLINQLQAKYSDAVTKFNQDTSGSVDPKLATTIQKQILLVKKQLEDALLKQALAKHDYNLKIYTLQDKLLESKFMIPGKYAFLNESNIHSAKVYITSLVNEESPMHGMVDVKHTFKDSQLFYGKDKQGYFIICIDQEDFDRMYNALAAVGYTREEILDAIMPQVFDRRGLVQ